MWFVLKIFYENFVFRSVEGHFEAFKKFKNSIFQISENLIFVVFGDPKN